MATMHRTAADLLVARLTSHEDAEAAILREYQVAAETAQDPAVRFLMRLIIEDEERHKGWMASVAESIHELEASGNARSVPEFAEPAPDTALLAKTEQFVEAERRTLDELKVLRRTADWVAGRDRHLYGGTELAPSAATGRWAEDSPLHILIEAMMQDTKRHVQILEAIDHRMRRSMASWMSALPLAARAGRRLGRRQTVGLGAGLLVLVLVIVLAAVGFTRQPAGSGGQSAAVAADAAVSGMQLPPPAATSVPPPEPNPLTPLAPGGNPEFAPVPGADLSKNGPAASIHGSLQAGQLVFTQNCLACHGVDGKGGFPNAGSDDGTVPALNPIDPGFAAAAKGDPAAFAREIDLFIQHGSRPSGPNPMLSMVPWGDAKRLTQQQIADVEAYVMQLNGVSWTK